MPETQLQIPGYRIAREIGQGGMATVYEAVQESLDRRVALKLMDESLSQDRTFCERFVKEGKIVAQLSHPNIVTVYEIGCHSDKFFMAMEYIAGATLQQRIREQTPVPNALGILSQIAGALGYAHARGFIHRDVKPGNILFRQNESVVLTDFGIAKPMTDATQLTAVGFAVGTPEYMSPEQAMAQSVDGRSDLYSLGVVFFEMLTGRKPYVGEDAISVVMQHAQSPIPRLPPSHVAYQKIIDKLMAKKREERFADAEELISYIYRLVEESRKRRSRSKRSESFSGETRAVVQGATVPQLSATGEHPEGGILVRTRWPLLSLATLVLLGFMVAGYLWLGYPYPGRQIEQPLPESLTPMVDTEPPDLPVDADANRKKIARLLEVAAAHEAVGRLDSPPGSNAYDAYQLVLEIDPDNPQALAGLRRLESLIARRGR